MRSYLVALLVLVSGLVFGQNRISVTPGQTSYNITAMNKQKRYDDSIKVCNRRYNDSIRVQEHYSKLNPGWLQHSPGYELQLYSKNYYGGLALSTVGTLLMIEGINSTDSSDRNLITNVGALFSLAGGILIIKSGIHIKRAGIIMDRNGVGFRIPLSKK